MSTEHAEAARQDPVTSAGPAREERSTAQPTRTLGWADLLPETEPFEDPFEALSPEQLRMLSLLVRVRTMEVEKPKSVTDGMREEVAKYERDLREQRVDIEGLLARREEIRVKRAARAHAVVPELDGARVRMPGYLLPLEYEAEKVVEFLLVPWVGACIHTPPPAPNQIVHVRLEEAIAYPGYFKPVWVVGVLSTKASSEELYHVDGKAVVPTAYSMLGASVSAYEG